MTIIYVRKCMLTVATQTLVTFKENLSRKECVCVCVRVRASLTVNTLRGANLRLTSWVGLFLSAARSKQLPSVCFRERGRDEGEFDRGRGRKRKQSAVCIDAV